MSYISSQALVANNTYHSRSNGNGRTFYVGSSTISRDGATITGSDSSGAGMSPEAPFASIAYATATATTPIVANRGDILIVLPGHTETIVGAAGVLIATAVCDGLTIQGVGNGRKRPIINYTTAIGASFDVSAANVTIRNIVFTPNGFDAITAAMNVTGADFVMDGCEWAICNAAADKQCVLGILTAATATRFTVKNTKFLGPATVTGTTCTACIKHEVGIDFEISNCDFHGKMTQAILNATTILGGKIHDNRFQIYTGTKGIALAAATTALISNNRFNVPSGTAPIVAAAGFCVGNAYSAAAGVTAGTALTF